MQRSLALTALALAVAVLVSYATVVLGDDTWDDVPYHAEIAPPRLAAAAAVARGDAPGWWDGTGFGVPLLGEPGHGALAPTLWPARTPRELDALLVLHLWWAGLGVAAWARRRGASELAGLGAGLLVATSGVFASAAIRGALPALAMLPWIGVASLALVEARDRGARARAALGLGAALGALALAGQLAALVDACIVIAACAAGRAAWRWLLAAVAAGLAIGAAQWVPAALQIPREVGAHAAGLPLARLVELVAPGRSHAAGAWFPSVFIGAGLFALARPQRREVIALVACALGALVAGRGDWPAWAGAPEVHLGALVALLAACAGRGLDDALAGDARAARALWIGAGVTAVGAIAAMVARSDGDAARDGAVACVGLVGAGVLAWRPRGGWAAPVLLALVAAPSVGALPETAPTAPRAPLEEPPAWAAAALAAAPQPSAAPVRVFRPIPFELVNGLTDLGLVDSVATLAGASAAPWGLALAHGQDPARDPGEERVWMASANEGGALLERYGVGVAVLPTSLVGPRGFHAIGDRGGHSLVDLPVSSLAVVVHGWLWAVAPSDALALLFPPGGGRLPLGTIVLRGAGESSGQARPPTPCAIDDWRAGAIALTCDARDAAGYAVVSGAPSPGWRAQIDDADAPVLTADVLRRAVALPSGPHRVRWMYAAPGFGLGAGIAGGGLLGLGALAVLAVRARRRRGDPAVE